MGYIVPDYQLCVKRHSTNVKTILKGYQKDVDSGVNQILLECALIDEIQKIIDHCNEAAFTSFKARLELEDTAPAPEGRCC